MAELYTLPDGWEWKELGDVFIVKDGTHDSPKYIEENGYPLFTSKNLKENGLDYSNFKLISEKDYIKINQRSKVDKGDLLFAMIGTIGNPTIIEQEANFAIKNVALFKPMNLENRIEFLRYYFLSNFVIDKMINEANGATQKFVGLTYLRNFLYPQPPLEEQKRIMAKLDILFAKIDKAIALHQKNIDEANVFMASVLNDVFVELEEKYEKIPLFDVADVNRGKSKHRPRNDKKLFGGNYPFIQTGDVRNANKYIDTFNETYSEFGLSQSKLWKKATICMTIAANIGDVAILNIDSCFPDSVVGIYSENNSNDFLYYFLLTLKQQLESQATTTAQMNINLKVLQTIGVPLPPLKTQQKVVSYLDEISSKMEKIKQIQKEKMQSLKALKASILDQAFKGEL